LAQSLINNRVDTSVVQQTETSELSTGTKPNQRFSEELGFLWATEPCEQHSAWHMQLPNNQNTLGTVSLYWEK